MCVCVCVCNTNYKRIIYLKCLSFLWLETGGFSETGKSLIVNVCLRGPSILLLFDVCWVTLEGVCCRCEEIVGKERKSVGKRRIYRKYASWKRLQTQDENLRADLVLSRSRGSPGQWFPETEYVSVRHLCCGNKWHTAQNDL